MSNIVIRDAVQSDLESIIQFNVNLASETENKDLLLEKIKPGVQALFNNPEYGFYLVAELDSNLAGSLMVTKEWSDWRNGTFWWIQSVYVKAEFRRKGVYSSLYSEVCSRAKHRTDVCGCRLYVEKKNYIAQNTYLKLGMQEAYYKVFETEFSN